MSDKAPKDVTFLTGWEDSEISSVETLVCSCGTNLLEGYPYYTASHEKTIECPNCGSKYQFIWMGMTIKKVESGKKETR